MRLPALLLLALVATATAQTENLVQVATRLNLTSLAGFLTTAGLIETLQGTGPFTVFAPTNEAFDALPDSVRDSLSDVAVLKDVLLYHVHSGNVPSSAITNNALVPMLNNATDNVRANIYGSVITVNGRQVTGADNTANNGVLHVVNGVLLAPAGNLVEVAQADSSLTTLVSLVVQTNLTDALSGPDDSPLTVFAPDNTAFTNAGLDTSNNTVVASILRYHIVSDAVYSSALSNGMIVRTLEGPQVFISVTGGNVYVNTAKVTAADVTASNGVVHKLDKPLIPPARDIVDLAISVGLSKLVEAVTAAGLVDTLRNGNFTVFAPSNAAFDAAGLDLTDRAQLDRVLKYHLVSTVTYSFGLSNGQEIDTVLSGSAISVSIAGNSVTLNGEADVGSPDQQTSNGVVHIIDKVLDPDRSTGAARGLAASLGLLVAAAAARFL